MNDATDVVKSLARSCDIADDDGGVFYFGDGFPEAVEKRREWNEEQAAIVNGLRDLGYIVSRHRKAGWHSIWVHK